MTNYVSRYAEAAFQPGRYLVLAAAVAFVLYLPGQDHGLWRTSEARDCEIAREMLASGDFAVPRFNGQVFLEKPPLFYAAIALAFRLFGVSERSARIPGFFFAVLALLGAAVIGKRLRDEKLGLAMLLVTGTTSLFLKRGHEAYLDVALSATVIWALAFYLLAEQGRTEKPRFAFLLGFYLMLTAAFFVKGLVGPLLPLLTLSTYLAWQRDFRGFLRLQPWLGVLLFLILAAPWHYELWRQAGGKYLSVFYVDNHLYRFVKSEEVDLGHHTVWYWHFWSIWKFFAPWSLLFPAAGAALFRRDFREWLGSAGFKFLVSWLVPSFVFFTISSTKREDYLLPLYPALGGLVSAWILFRHEKNQEPKWERYYTTAFGLVVAGLCFYVPAAAAREYEGSWVWFGLASLVSAAAGAGVVYRLIRRPTHQVWSLVLMAALAAGFAGSSLLLKIEEKHRDQSVFAKKTAQLTASAAGLYALGTSETERAVLGFYCRRQVVNAGLPPDPGKLPPAGIRFPVAVVARTKEQVEDRRQALLKLGYNLEEALREEVGKRRLCILWWVSKP